MPGTADRPAADGRDLQVAVVAYGAPELLEEALQGLHGRYPATVVDNSSSSEVRAVAERAGARYIDPGANLGFAAGVNLALSDVAVDETDVLLLNPDAVIEPAEIERLHDALLAGPRTACAAPSQRAPGSEGMSAGTWRWHTPAAAWAEAVGMRQRPGEGFLSGAVLMLRGEALSDVGRFDERYFLYAEEEDWQHRARRHGWELRYCPEIAAVHAAGSTHEDVGELQLRLHSSTERYLRKWYGPAGWLLYRSGVVVGHLARAMLRRGPRRRASLALAKLYLFGPDRTALRRGVLPPSSAGLTVRRNWARGSRRAHGTAP